jgi:hypothetical protein
MKANLFIAGGRARDNGATTIVRAALWGRLTIWITATLVLMVSVVRCEATTFFIDAFAPGGVPGTARSLPSNVCYHAFCGYAGYQTAVYYFNAGDIADFGTVTIYDMVFGAPYEIDPGTGEVLVYGYGLYAADFADSYDGSGFVGAGNVPIGECFSSDPNCPDELVVSSVTVRLLFQFSFSTDFQIGWSGPFDYSAPVRPTPLPAALPLFAGGLGTLGLLGWRRKRKAAAS